MRHHFLLVATMATGAIVARSASAQVVFQDNFEAQPDGDTASVWQGGTPNDPPLGDADPHAPAVGTWGPIFENNPWFVQVSTATNGPTTGPAGGTGKYLTMMRNNNPTPSDARGAFATPGTNLVSMDFQIALSQGDMQYFVRGTNGGSFNTGGFSFLPVYVNFTLDGNVNVNGTVSPGVFEPGGYESVHLDYNIPAQTVSVSVNGVSTPTMTRPFLEPVTTLNQFSFYVIDSGVAGFDNVSASLLPLYWDTNGTVAGAGGPSPSGTWDGTPANFNSDPTGGAGGRTITAMTAGDNIVFGAGTDATGPYTVTLSGARAAARVTFEDGNVTLTGGSLATGALRAEAGIQAMVASVLNGGALVKEGPGTVTLGAANTYTGGTTVSAGTLVLGNADATAGGSINVADGALARAQPGLSKAVTVTTLNTNTSGKFDLTDNSMVVKGMTADQVRGLIQGAFNAGHWNGATGLDSSTAAANVGGTTAIGYGTAGFLNKSSFKGASPLNSTDVLVKYTYYGDNDLSGNTTLDDFTLFLGGYQNGGTTWAQGDYDYSGTVTLDDFTLFLKGYQQQGAQLSQLESLINSMPMSETERSAMLAAVQAVPEPTGLALLGMGGIVTLARRRRV